MMLSMDEYKPLYSFYPFLFLHFGSFGPSRGAESEPESEPGSPGVVAASKESDSESESIKLPRLQFRNVLFESVI